MSRIALSLILFPSLTTPAPIVAQEDTDLARAVLEQTPLIDGHNDLPWAIRNFEDAPHDVLAYDIARRAPGRRGCRSSTM